MYWSLFNVPNISTCRRNLVRTAPLMVVTWLKNLMVCTCITLPLEPKYVIITLSLSLSLAQTYRFFFNTGSRMSNLTHSTHNTNAAWSSGEHSVPLSYIFDCSNITCQQGFYCEEQGSSAMCSPNCYTWTQFPRSISIAIDFGILLAECVGVISGVALFVVAGMRWRKVYALTVQLLVFWKAGFIVTAWRV